MTQFLNTSATNYFLPELIKNSKERLFIISPFLKFNDRIKELLSDKDRMKIDIRIVYGKSELSPQEINWLRSLEFVRTSFCQNLHAKCYLNERSAIITSMNLYDFSQVNNNEMGVFFDRTTESELYLDTYEEAQRLIRISEQVRLSAETIIESDDKSNNNFNDKLTTSKIANALKIKTSQLKVKLVDRGFLQEIDGKLKLTDSGKDAGGEYRFSKKFGPYFIWPKDIITP